MCDEAKTIIAEAMPTKKKNPTFVFEGEYIAAGMAYYLKNGNQCYRYHELFFNELLSLLDGALGHDNKGLKEYVHSFEKWYFAHHRMSTTYLSLAR